MAEGKKKRSLREAFGVVQQPGEKATAQETPGSDAVAAPVAAPEGGKPAPRVEETPKKAADRKTRASSNGKSSGAGSRSRRKSSGGGETGEPMITGKAPAARGGGRGRASSGENGREDAGGMVPGKGGKMVPAETPVNMTFTVTARERYLWTLELKRRGLTAVGVLRETMEGMVGEEQG